MWLEFSLYLEFVPSKNDRLCFVMVAVGTDVFFQFYLWLTIECVPVLVFIFLYQVPSTVQTFFRIPVCYLSVKYRYIFIYRLEAYLWEI
jgi:hypothetical protein